MPSTDSPLNTLPVNVFVRFDAKEKTNQVVVLVTAATKMHGRNRVSIFECVAFIRITSLVKGEGSHPVTRRLFSARRSIWNCVCSIPKGSKWDSHLEGSYSGCRWVLRLACTNAQAHLYMIVLSVVRRLRSVKVVLAMMVRTDCLGNPGRAAMPLLLCCR